MVGISRRSPGFLEFIRLVIDGDVEEVSRHLARSPALATTASGVGATRQGASTFFYADIARYLYAGDTALHMAAAAFRPRVAELLIGHGADCRAKNRRGAEPLHYAADGNRWDPIAQAKTIEFLVSVGADANAVDRSGVAPLHRAVRTRSLAAVRALLDGGADPRQPNKSGSTPLHLAVQLSASIQFGEAALIQEMHTRLVVYCVALERVLLKNSTESVTQNLGERLALFVRDKPDERNQVVDMAVCCQSGRALPPHRS